jgi:iron complex outermembrane recepter protein
MGCAFLDACRIRLCAVVALGAVAASANAEAPAPGPNDDGIEPIVVTAQRRSQDVQRVPISIQAFTAKAISDLGIKSSTDLGQVTPNITIALPSGVGNQPIITIRGIGLNDFDTNNAGPNGVYLDEVYLSSPASQTFQTFDLDRIEVLKGPQGTLYGRNTSGGAINFVSAKPTPELTGNFHIEYSSYNTVNVEGAVSGPVAQNLEGRIAVVENHSDGYLRNTYLNTNLGTQNYGVRGMLLDKLTDTFKVLVSVHGGQVDNPFPGYQFLGDFVPGTQFAAAPTVCSVQQTYANKCVDIFGYRHVGGFYDEASERLNRLRVNSAGGYIRADWTPGAVNFTSITAIEHLDKRDDEDGDATPDRLLEVTFGVRSTAVSQEFRASRSTDNYNWVAGLYYLHEDLHQNQPLSLLLSGDQYFGAGAFDGVAITQFDTSHQITDSYAGFGQGEYSITDKLKAVLGGRYTSEFKSFQYDGSAQYQAGGEGNFGPLIQTADSHQHLADSAFSWRAGLNYQLTETVMAYGSAATGFKSGVFNGSFLSTNAAEIARQLEPVRPETVRAYEVGIKSSFFDRRLIANAALFYNDYRDMQVFILAPPVAGGLGATVNVLDNAKKAHTDGIDLSLVGKPWSNLTLSAQVGLLETKLDQFVADRDPLQPNYSGNQLPMSPHVSAELAGDYRIPLGRNSVDVQLNASYKGHQFFDISNDPYITQSAYWIVNTRLGYLFNSDKIEVAAFVRNIAGQKYYVDKFDFTSGLGFIEGIVGTPMTIGVEFNAHY